VEKLLTNIDAKNAYEIGVADGRKEVVEWVEKAKVEGYDCYDNEKAIYLYYLEVTQWQAQRKGWGVI